jgi:hypothetical protein
MEPELHESATKRDLPRHVERVIGVSVTLTPETSSPASRLSLSSATHGGGA